MGLCMRKWHRGQDGSDKESHCNLDGVEAMWEAAGCDGSEERQASQVRASKAMRITTSCLAGGSHVGALEAVEEVQRGLLRGHGVSAAFAR